MHKVDMREWIASLEVVLDNKLNKWRKQQKIENGEAVQLHYQFEQSHMLLDIFWQEHHENVHFQFHSPRAMHRFEWDGLNDTTFNKIMDRAGNLAQVVMYPPSSIHLNE